MNDPEHHRFLHGSVYEALEETFQGVVSRLPCLMFGPCQPKHSGVRRKHIADGPKGASKAKDGPPKMSSAKNDFASRNEVIRMKKLRDSDMEEVFSRSSGPGGQHVNKVSTAFTLCHVPTGLREPVQKQAAWRTDPKRPGAAGCIGDIGTHAENLAEYITGLPKSSAPAWAISEK